MMRRGAILNAAKIEFAEHGYGRAKLEDIARRAEFGKGTLYNYFKGGKRGMLFAIFDQLYDNMIEMIESYLNPETLEKKSFRQAFYDYTLSSISFYLERKELFMILVKEAHRMCFGEDEDKAFYFRKQQERVVSVLSRPIKQAIDRGEIRKMEPRALAHMILGNLQGIQVHLILATDGNNCNRSHGDAPSDLLADSKPAAAASSKTPSATFSVEEAAGFLTTLLLDGLINRP